MPTIDKTLMILGAGASQIPAIKRAAELGVTVVCVDNVPDNRGHRYAHRSINCSTVDRNGIFRWARDSGIDGIMTFASDVATPSVAFVADRLHLPGPSSSATAIMSDKGRFREFQCQHGFFHPKFYLCRQENELEGILPQLTPPVLFKPVDSSGSRGISLLKRITHGECRKAYGFAMSCSRSHSICIEEFVDGIDLSCDGFLKNGRSTIALTLKKNHGVVPISHIIPTGLSKKLQHEIQRLIERTCSLLGYTEGPLDADLKLAGDRVYMIEISPRLGGNGIPAIVQRASGIDLIETTVRYALNEPIDSLPEIVIERPCGVLIFGSTSKGLLTRIAEKNEIQETVPEIYDYVLNYQCGEIVPAFTNSACSIGSVFFDIPKNASGVAVIDKITAALNLKVQKKHSERSRSAL